MSGIRSAMLVRTAAWLAAVLVSCGGCSESVDSSATTAGPAPLHPQAQREFLDDLSRRTFTYFWETTDPDTCLAPDRWPSAPFSSIAAIGFALTAYGIGAENGYVARDAAAERTLRCLENLESAPQGPEVSGTAGYRGFFYHFLRLDDGTRYRNNELSSVDTSLLMAGVLFAQSYFDGTVAREAAIRETADALYRRVEWTFFQRGDGDEPARNLAGSRGIPMGWTPEAGFGTHDWVGYNEGMLVYALALGSPTHAPDVEAWHRGWAVVLEKKWQDFYGYEHLNFEPLFGHQYSHVWIDFRGIQDDFIRGKGIDYFENSRRATLSQYQYAQANPGGWAGYGGDFWGITASDGPGIGRDLDVGGKPVRFWTYSARGASAERIRDDGTIAPTAAGGSLPFAPEIAIPALFAMKERYGEHLYTDYGFRDSFNATFTFGDAGSRQGQVIPGLGWIANDHLGIDQGPILAMLENYRSELVWTTMKKNPYVRNGLVAIGFRGGWLE